MTKSSHLPDVDIWMNHRNLIQVPQFPMPNGYRMRFYRDGDVAKWVAIQQSADRLFTATAETFSASMPGDTNYLSQRVMFLVDPTGRDVGSITAWQTAGFQTAAAGFQTATAGFKTTHLAKESLIGQVHWVAIGADQQGKGLSRPMLSACCQKMLAFGLTEACLSTNTKRIPALNLYLKFGFEPFLKSNTEKEAWEEIGPLLKY